MKAVQVQRSSLNIQGPPLNPGSKQISALPGCNVLSFGAWLSFGQCQALTRGTCCGKVSQRQMKGRINRRGVELR
ncbi:hypothetical protein NQZ68_012013 [Dissostichus eleginoides]|nr:hypothetical protein NQZ68_012013 [Dissostichus eleginoides]